MRQREHTIGFAQPESAISCCRWLTANDRPLQTDCSRCRRRIELALSTLTRHCTVSSADVRPLSKQMSNDPLYRRVQAEVRILDYSQTTLPKKIRTMSAGPQSLVLTFTKVPTTSAQPAI